MWPWARKVNTTSSPTFAVALFGEKESAPDEEDTSMETTAAEASAVHALRAKNLENMMMLGVEL